MNPLREAIHQTLELLATLQKSGRKRPPLNAVPRILDATAKLRGCFGSPRFTPDDAGDHEKIGTFTELGGCVAKLGWLAAIGEDSKIDPNTDMQPTIDRLIQRLEAQRELLTEPEAGELDEPGIEDELTGYPLKLWNYLLLKSNKFVTFGFLSELWPDTPTDKAIVSALKRVRAVLNEHAEAGYSLEIPKTDRRCKLTGPKAEKGPNRKSK